MNLRDFDFQLPPELIAQAPPPRREDARLMVLHRQGPLEHRGFPDLLEYLRPDDVLVLNDTKVLPARLFLKRATGGRIEALLLRKREDGAWEVLLQPSSRLKSGERLEIEGRPAASIEGSPEAGAWRLRFDDDIERRLAELGRTPLPPYIKRNAGPTPDDLERYQTVYAAKPGAIAAPTAGLHFTPGILDRIAAAGVEIVRITLHVGMGTFQPVKNLEHHRMEPEQYEIGEDAAERILRAKRVVAVGTTSCRAIESWARTGERSGSTALFIQSPFEFRRVGALVTNFHVPCSTLLMLVSAFAGREKILAAYGTAVELRYRFFSYGDAMLITD